LILTDTEELCRIYDLDVYAPVQATKCGLDLINPRGMIEV